MNLEAELLKAHSKAQALRIQHYIGNNSDRLGELVTLFLKGSYRVTQRAAWPLSLCIERHSNLARPYLGVIIKNLNKPNLHDAVKRNSVRLLQFVAIPKRLQGPTASICFRYLQDAKEPIAVRVFAMTVLANISHNLPDLKMELTLILEDHLPYGSAGFTARARKILKQVKK